MPTRSVITIGNFDGVHLGHRAILRRARKLADAKRARVIALTFDPHPASVLRPGAQPPTLSRTHRRIEHLMEAGADQVHLLRPTSDLLAQTPEGFVDRLIGEFHPAAIIEGPDFRFGKARAGDLDTLRALGASRGFAVEAVPDVEVTLYDRLRTTVSSSLIRWLVGRGRVADAALALGRPFELETTIARGEQRGRTIGIPTANLDLDALEGQILPADGVYAGQATLEPDTSDALPSSDIPHPPSPIPHPPPLFPAAISVGVKPSFGEKQLTIEAHLLDYEDPDPDALYGRTVRLCFARFLRDQYPFPGPEALGAQLRRDIARVQALTPPAPPPAPPRFD